MPRLIDADALNWGRCPANGKLVSDWLAETPTIEAEPVRHGRWVQLCAGSTQTECNQCGWLPTDGKTNYCPNCGAKMDGDSHD